MNGSQVALSPAPIIRDGRVFVPLRGVFEQLGASVDYSNGTIDATGNGREIVLEIGSTQATVNQQPQTIDVAPFIIGASTYVPLRFISESLGDSVSWDEANQVAAIDTGGGQADYYSPGTASYVDTAPPPIPEYEQPPAPAPDVIWQPGYWAWGAYGYYWVPGTWVEAPQTGYLWTPGYWHANNVGYNWYPGYWALAVGFYGGVNYGAGYFGNGYEGARWQHDHVVYNTYVTHVNTTIVHNVYIDRTVVINNSTTHISYNGGRGGIRAVPTTQQLAVAHDRHVGMTPVQQQHIQQAEQNRAFLETANHGKPPVFAVPHPLSLANKPAGFTPVTSADRVDPQANVVPVHPVTHQLVRAAPHTLHAPASITHVAPPVTHPATASIVAPVVHHPIYAPVVRHAPIGAPVGAPVAQTLHVPAVHAAPITAHTYVHTSPLVHTPIVHTPIVHAPITRVTRPVHPVVHPLTAGHPEAR